MDLLYSRRKIKLPNLNGEKNINPKKLRILVIVLIAVTTLAIILKSINPIFEEKCKEKVQEIATNIINNEASKVLKQKDYGKIVDLVKDDKGNISIIKSDVVIINEISSDIAVAIQNELSNLNTKEIELPLGSFLGSRLIVGLGPNVKLNIITSGNIKTDIKTEFKTTGINQTLHRIYLELQCEAKILTPFETIDTVITNQVLLVETVIIGDIPTSYYNLNGMEQNNLTDLMK